MTSSTPPSAPAVPAASGVKQNPNRPNAPVPDPARPFVVSHPLFSYTTRVPIDTRVAKDFPSPFASEDDFTPSPPLFYAHAAPVEECVERHLTKYPHPSVPEILSCPVVSDSTDPLTGVRTRVRTVKCKNFAPWLIRKALGSSDHVQLVEKSTFDPRTREFKLESHNENFAKLVYAQEASRFVPHPDNPQWTSFVQYGGIRCSSFLGPFKRPLEQLVCNRMVQGGLQASDLLDDLINSQAPF